MKKYFTIAQSGVTLVEMLVVMGLLSIMLIVISTIFTSAADVQQESNSYSATLSSGRFIMARLNYDIARSTSVSTPASLGATSSTLQTVIGGTTFSYALSGANLQLTDGSGTDNLNSDDVQVSNLSFTELGTVSGEPTITYSFTLTSIAKSHGQADVHTFTSSQGLF